LVGVDIFEPDKDPLAAGPRPLLDKSGCGGRSVSTWMMIAAQTLALRISISRSKIASQLRLRAKLSSVMKKRKTPWARLARTSRSTFVASRQRDYAPLHIDDRAEAATGMQPRPASKAPIVSP